VACLACVCVSVRTQVDVTAPTTDANEPCDISAVEVTSAAHGTAPSSAWVPHEHESWRRTKLTSLKGEGEYEALRREEAAKAKLVDALAFAVEVSPPQPCLYLTQREACPYVKNTVARPTAMCNRGPGNESFGRRAVTTTPSSRALEIFASARPPRDTSVTVHS
jgi:hypothetical protein